MTTPEPNNAEAIRRSLALLDQFEGSLEEVFIEDRKWPGIERNIKDLRYRLESELKKLEDTMLYLFTRPA